MRTGKRSGATSVEKRSGSVSVCSTCAVKGIGAGAPDLFGDVATPSFPSGHAMAAAAIYLTLAALVSRLVEERRAKAFVVSVALVLVLLIGVSRVYLGVHWPSDVLAGWTAGLSWAVACWIVMARLQRRGVVEKPSETTSELPD